MNDTRGCKRIGYNNVFIPLSTLECSGGGAVWYNICSSNGSTDPRSGSPPGYYGSEVGGYAIPYHSQTGSHTIHNVCTSPAHIMQAAAV